jgi:hypothetical protein
MPRFLIEVPHDPDPIACARVVQVFLTSGSHFLTHADWGCKDNDHRAWVTVDVDSKAEALGIVPPAFRADARIVTLTRFTIEEIDAVFERHKRKHDAHS